MTGVVGVVFSITTWYPSVTSTPIFKLNTIFTPLLLIIAWTFLTGEEFFLKPIECTFSNCKGCDETLKKFINTWCWMSSTYTIPETFKYRNEHAPYPGVLPNAAMSEDLNPPKLYNYYQYVLYALVSQGLFFVWIGTLWSYWENNFMVQLTRDCKRYAISKDEIKDQVDRFVEYFSRHMNFHTQYVFRYWFCELLCFLNVLLQMILIDWFFNGDFSKFGVKMLNLLEEQPQERTDSLMLIFPKMTKCTFHKFGPSGDIEKRDALCVLGQNNYNEKVYVFIWFWYWILLIFSGAVVIFRISLIVSLRIRINVLGSRDFSIPEPVVRKVAERAPIGDWWCIYMLALNVDGRVFKDFMQSLSDKMTNVVPVKEDGDNVETRIETY